LDAHDGNRSLLLIFCICKQTNRNLRFQISVFFKNDWARAGLHTQTKMQGENRVLSWKVVQLNKDIPLYFFAVIFFGFLFFLHYRQLAVFIFLLFSFLYSVHFFFSMWKLTLHSSLGPYSTLAWHVALPDLAISDDSVPLSHLPSFFPQLLLFKLIARSQSAKQFLSPETWKKTLEKHRSLIPFSGRRCNWKTLNNISHKPAYPFIIINYNRHCSLLALLWLLLYILRITKETRTQNARHCKPHTKANRCMCLLYAPKPDLPMYLSVLYFCCSVEWILLVFLFPLTLPACFTLCSFS